MIDNNTTYVRSKAVISRTHKGEIHAMHAGQGGMLVLKNRTAILIWQALTKKRTLIQLLEIVAGNYPDTDRKTVAGDLEKLLADLIKNKYVVPGR